MAPTSPRLPLGSSDFTQLRRHGLHDIDKSGFIAEVLRSPGQVLLLPRPRRFGKTLSLSALAAFVERTDEDRAELFADLAVRQAGDDVRRHFGRYPIVFLTFKNLKTRTRADCRAAIASLVARACGRHRAVVEPVLSEQGRRSWHKLLAGEAGKAPVAGQPCMRW